MHGNFVVLLFTGKAPIGLFKFGAPIRTPIYGILIEISVHLILRHYTHLRNHETLIRLLESIESTDALPVCSHPAWSEQRCWTPWSLLPSPHPLESVLNKSCTSIILITTQFQSLPGLFTGIAVIRFICSYNSISLYGALQESLGTPFGAYGVGYWLRSNAIFCRECQTLFRTARVQIV